jgi:hypothetical protein
MPVLRSHRTEHHYAHDNWTNLYPFYADIVLNITMEMTTEQINSDVQYDVSLERASICSVVISIVMFSTMWA